MLSNVRAGDSVTIVTRSGIEITGRAVMYGPVGWVLKIGEPSGTPAIATDENTVRVRKAES